MGIGFDKRLELLYGILYCVNKDMNNTLHPGLFIEEMPTYCNEFYKLYKNGITDEFIELIKNKGINNTWATPAIIALSLDENYNIIENECLLEKVKNSNPYYDKEKIERCLKEFVEKSNYEEFYNDHKQFYNNIIDSYRESMFNILDKGIIEEFYGYKIGKMRINLYNFTTGSSGAFINNIQYYNQRVDNMNDDENNFKFKCKINNIFHEFSHPYIAPLVKKYCSNIYLDNLFEEAKANGLKTDVYQTMKSNTIWDEYIVRSIALHLEKKYNSKENIEKRIEIEKNNGFIHVEEISKLFDNKDNYNSFEEFFKNELVPFIIELNKR